MAGGTIAVIQYIYTLLFLSSVFVIFTKFGCDLLHHLSHLTVKYLLIYLLVLNLVYLQTVSYECIVMCAFNLDIEQY